VSDRNEFLRAGRPITRGKLLDHAADVARHFIGFEAYQGSRARAAAALRRRAPGFAESQYERALQKALAMFRAAVKIMDENAPAVFVVYRTGESDFATYDFEPYVSMLRREHPGFPRSTYEWVLAWIFLYFHLM
jgi:hypothetical protein